MTQHLTNSTSIYSFPVVHDLFIEVIEVESPRPCVVIRPTHLLEALPIEGTHLISNLTRSWRLGVC